MLALLARRLILAYLTLATSAGPAAAAPRDEVLRYVPDDIGFCLVVQDLRGQTAQVLASPFAQAFGKSALASVIVGSKEWKQLGDVEKYLKKHLGVNFAEIRDDLLGDAFAFAYRPGPPDKPEQEQGIFLLRAREGKPLAELLRKLNALQKESGELKELTEREHKGVKYFRRVEKKETNYYLLSDKMLLFTGQEALLRLAIERDQTLARDAEPGLTKRLRELGLERALAALLIQPRTFDAALAAKENDVGAKTVARCWKALDGLGMGLTVGRDVELSLVFKGRAERLPPAARRLLEGGKASELWSAFPQDAMFAAAGRLDFAALYEFFGELMPKVSKQAADTELERTLGAMLGKSVIKEVLPALGPDWGVCVTAPTEAREWTPRVLAAVRVARGEEDDPIDQALFSGVESWAQLGVLAHNKKHPNRAITLRTTTIDRARVRYLSGDNVLPAGVQPAFGLRGGYLVLSSSLAELRRFKVGTPPVPGTAVPLLRVGVKSLRAYLKDHHESLAAVLAAQEKLTKEKAAARLDELRMSLELIDRLELRQQAQSERVTFTLALTPSQPLKKP